MEPVQRLGHHADGRVEADAELGCREVVVDGLRHPDRLEARVVQLRRHAQRVVAADGHERIDGVVSQGVDHTRDSVHLFGWVRARGAEDGAAHRQNAAHVGRRELVDQAFLEAPGPAVLDAAHLVPQLERSPRHGADRGVEARRVSTSGENSDPHGE